MVQKNLKETKLKRIGNLLEMHQEQFPDGSKEVIDIFLLETKDKSLAHEQTDVMIFSDETLADQQVSVNQKNCRRSPIRNSLSSSA